MSQHDPQAGPPVEPLVGGAFDCLFATRWMRLMALLVAAVTCGLAAVSLAQFDQLGSLASLSSAVAGVLSGIALVTFFAQLLSEIMGAYERHEATRMLIMQGLDPELVTEVEWTRVHKRREFLAKRWASTGVFEVAWGVAIAVGGVFTVLAWRMDAPLMLVGALIGIAAAPVLAIYIRLYLLWPAGWVFTREQRRVGGKWLVAAALAGAWTGHLLGEGAALVMGDSVGLQAVWVVGPLAGVAACYGAWLREPRYLLLAAYFFSVPVLAAGTLGEVVGDAALAGFLIIASGLILSGASVLVPIVIRTRRYEDPEPRIAEMLDSGTPDEQALAAWLAGAFSMYKLFDRLLAAGVAGDDWYAYEATVALDMMWGPPADVRLQWLLDAEYQETQGAELSDARFEALREQAEHDVWDHGRAFRMYVQSTASLDDTVVANARSMMHSVSWIWSSTGARMLGMASTPQSIAALFEALVDGPKSVSVAAARLGFLYLSPHDAQRVADLLMNQRAHVRIGALHAVEAVVRGATEEGDAETHEAITWATPLLEQASRHPRAATRARAAFVAPVMGPAAAGLLTPLLTDGRWGVRGLALVGLCSIEAPGWRDAATTALSDPHAWVRGIAAGLLERPTE